MTTPEAVARTIAIVADTSEQQQRLSASARELERLLGSLATPQKAREEQAAPILADSLTTDLVPLLLPETIEAAAANGCVSFCGTPLQLDQKMTSTLKITGRQTRGQQPDSAGGHP